MKTLHEVGHWHFGMRSAPTLHLLRRDYRADISQTHIAVFTPQDIQLSQALPVFADQHAPG